MSSWVLSISTEENSTLSQGNLCQCLSTPQYKNVFLCLDKILWLLINCLLSCQWASVRESGSLFFIPFCLTFTHMDKISLSLLLSRLDSLSSFSLFSYERWSSPFITFVALHWTHPSISVSLLYWQAQPALHPALQMYLTSAD